MVKMKLEKYYQLIDTRDYEFQQDLFEQPYSIGTIIVANDEVFLKKLEEIYIIEKLKGTQLYIIKEERKKGFLW